MCYDLQTERMYSTCISFGQFNWLCNTKHDHSFSTCCTSKWLTATQVSYFLHKIQGNRCTYSGLSSYSLVSIAVSSNSAAMSRADRDSSSPGTVSWKEEIKQNYAFKTVLLLNSLQVLSDNDDKKTRLWKITNAPLSLGGFDLYNLTAMDIS